MKLTYNGKVSVEAETEGDVVELITRYGGARRIDLGKTHQKHRPHKKHNYLKKCGVCGVACKGKQGLSTHMGWRHKETGNGLANIT